MKFKRWISALTVILFVFSSLFVSGCGDKKEREKKSDATMKVTAKANLGDGLDLQALLELVKREKTAEKIEEALNKDGSINNLDLNENGKIDYVKVHEYGDGDHRGLSFTVDMSDKDIQEIADVKFERAPDGNGKVVVQARGNENVYGQNHYYYDHWHAAEIAFLGYLFMPHPYYVSPYRYGYYPTYYAPRPIVSVSVYRTQRINTYVEKTSVQRSAQPMVKSTTVQSPNAGKNVSSVAARAPMDLKKDQGFAVRPADKPIVKPGSAGPQTGSVQTAAPKQTAPMDLKKDQGFAVRPTDKPIVKPEPSKAASAPGLASPSMSPRPAAPPSMSPASRPSAPPSMSRPSAPPSPSRSSSSSSGKR